MRNLRVGRPADLWLVIAAGSIWGTIGVATQAIYNTDTTTSLFINLGRMVVAAPVLLLVCRRVVGRKMFDIPRRDFLIMALSGVLLAISQASYFAGIRATGVTISTLLTVCISPLIVTFFSVLLKLEKLSGRVVLALALALVGSVLLIGLHAPEGAHVDLLLGTFYSVISAATYAGMILCGRFVASDYHPLQVTAVNFTAGTVLLAVINVASGAVIVHTAQNWLLILYLGLVPTALAYLLFQSGLRSVNATAASIITLLEPAVAALLAWLMFGETLAATGIAGAIMLALSIVLISVNNQTPSATGEI